MRLVNTYLLGLGHVHRSFLRILDQKAARLADQYGLAFRIVAVADSSGVALAPDGFDPAALLAAKEAGRPVRKYPGYQPGMLAPAVLDAIPCDLVLDASPVNLQTGEPGLGVVRTALARGVSVVLANKAPLVLAYAQLHDLARQSGAGLAYSATVCGALPVINLGTRDLIAADILSVRGILNSTTNFILGEMAAGRPYAGALAEAQQRGIAEADPSLDVEGWDTANKLVIIANSWLGLRATLNDVSVQGIPHITQADVQSAQAQGRVIKLIAQAQRNPDQSYTLTVGPQVLEQNEFLAACSSWEMGVEFTSDLYGRMFAKIWEREPLPTAAAMLRDAVNLWAQRQQVPSALP